MKTRHNTLVLLVLSNVVTGNILSGTAGERSHTLLGRRETSSVLWVENADAVLATAQQTGRPLLIYVTSSHCTYCRKMERETWSDPQLISLIESTVIPFRVSPETDPELVRRLGVRAFPTTFIITAEGQSFAPLVGYVSKKQMAEVLERVHDRSPLAADGGEALRGTR